MNHVRWNSMSFADAQQFNNVPAKPSMGYERVPDSNPNALFDWRFGIRVQRENIPSMIIGQEGFGRITTKHIPRHKITTVLDILIKREQRQLENRSGPIRVVAIHITIPNRYPYDSPKREESSP